MAEAMQPPQPVQPSVPTKPALGLDTFPAEWPGAFGIYKYSKAAMSLNLNAYIEIAIVGFVIDIVINLVFKDMKQVANLIAWLISPFISGATYIIIADAVQGRKTELGNAVKRASQLYFKMLILFVLIALSALSLLLLIVPGLIILPRITLAPWFLINNPGMSPVEAYKASWHASKGHIGKLWKIFGVGILMTLPVITIVGILLTLYWLIFYSAAIAFFFFYVIKHGPAVRPVAPGQAQQPPAVAGPIS